MRLLDSAGFRLFDNPRRSPADAYQARGFGEILSLAAFADAKREITSWPGYRPTPLRRPFRRLSSIPPCPP